MIRAYGARAWRSALGVGGVSLLISMAAVFCYAGMVRAH